MPKGILTRLTVRMHPFIADEQTCAWKEGFVLENHGATAEVIETHGKAEIHIKATGECRRKLLNEIAYEINRLNGEYHFSERIQSYMLLPCSCAICIGSAEPHFFKYPEVRKWKEEEWEQVPCGKTGKPAKVDDILSNILEGKEAEIFDAKRTAAELTAIREGQDDLKTLLENHHQIILEKLDANQISTAAQEAAFAALEPLLTALLEKLPQEKKAAVQEIKNAPDLKSKLKLAIPIIPSVLSYETELSWDWQKVKSSLRGLVM